MAWSDIVVTLDSWDATAVTLTAENPQSTQESARLRIVVNLVNGPETLETPVVTLDPGESHEFSLTPHGSIISITNDPEPFAP